MTRFEFNTRSFVLSHGRQPKGYGSWCFRFNGEQTDHFTPHSMTYTEAKKWMRDLVKANAPECEFALLTVCP